MKFFCRVRLTCLFTGLIIKINQITGHTVLLQVVLIREADSVTIIVVISVLPTIITVCRLL